MGRLGRPRPLSHGAEAPFLLALLFLLLRLLLRLSCVQGAETAPHQPPLFALVVGTPKRNTSGKKKVACLVAS